MHKFKKVSAALFSTGILAAGIAASSAGAAPVITGELVNVTVTDVLSHDQISVQVPIGVAANVCGVQANVLAQGGLQEPVDCTAATTADLPVAFAPGGRRITKRRN
jgi:hypothetical protein